MFVLSTRFGDAGAEGRPAREGWCRICFPSTNLAGLDVWAARVGPVSCCGGGGRICPAPLIDLVRPLLGVCGCADKLPLLLLPGAAPRIGCCRVAGGLF